MDYQLNDIVEMKKQHPCKKSNQWKIVRMGADFEKRLKKVVEHAE